MLLMDAIGRHPRLCKMARLYNLARWRKGRLRHLRENPTCVSCRERGIVTIANTLDHNPPHRNNYDAFFDEATWVSLCKQCHDSKTARHDGGFGNKHKQTSVGCMANGLPADRQHHWNKQ